METLRKDEKALLYYTFSKENNSSGNHINTLMNHGAIHFNQVVHYYSF